MRIQTGCAGACQPCVSVPVVRSASIGVGCAVTSAAILLVVPLYLAPSMAHAQAPKSAGDQGGAVSAGVLTGRPTVSATRATGAPTIDGRLDDPVWQSATRITDFVQQRPVEGAPATEQTEVGVAYDSEQLYFGIRVRYSDPGLIRANRVDRDQTDRDDTIQLFFDPFLDQQRGYIFSVNGYGVQGDQLLENRPVLASSRGGRQTASSQAPRAPDEGDKSWDAVFQSAGVLVEDGWVAEIAIPFKSLRYPARRQGEAHRWGFQIRRDIRSKDESVVWSPTSRDIPLMLPQMGVLEGLTNLSTARNLELLPSVTALQVGRLDGQTGAYSTDHLEEAGVNVKYGITSNLTLDLTYNPDFSQIESDRPQIEINERFPVMFPELRPFFLEGQEIYRIFGPVTLVHTRTIVDPRYGAKLTGKVGKTTLSVISANDEAPGRVQSREDPAFDKSARILMSRVRYDLYSESAIGMLVTDREFLDGHSRMGGVDAEFQVGRNHRTSAYVMYTSNRDQAGVQRTGRAWQVNLRKQGRNLGYFVAHYEFDPDFRTDTGFIRRVDQKVTFANLSYRWWPESWIVNWGPRGRYERNHDFNNVLQNESFEGGLTFQFAKNISANVDYLYPMERFRGVDFQKTRYSFGGTVNTSRRISFGGNVDGGDEIRFVADPFLGSSRDYAVNMTLRPIARLQSDVILDTRNFIDPRNETTVLDVKIFRAVTTYQFTDRLLLRNITEHNSFNKTLAANLLVTYRVNAGTVFFVGYDDHYRQGHQVDNISFPTNSWERTNRAVFAKLQYLFRI